MSEDLPNLGKLIKLLKMTTSTNDNEALMFVRKANDELKKFGGDWDTLLRGKVTVIGDPFDGLNIPSTRMEKTATNPAYRPSPSPAPRPSQPARPTSTRQKAPPAPPWSQVNPTPPPPPPPQPRRPRTNIYAAKCRCCGIQVDAQAGILISGSNGWRVECVSCFKGQTTQSQSAPKGGRKRGALTLDNLSALMGDIP